MNAIAIPKPGAVAREAVKRIIAGPGQITKVEPDRKSDPEAWAAWQAHRTFRGIHDEKATARLMELPTSAGQVWTELMEYLMARAEAERA